MFGITEGSISDPALPHQNTLGSVHQGEEHYPSTATRGQCSTSNRHSDSSEHMTDSRIGVAAPKNTTSLLNQGHADSFRDIRSEIRDNSDDSDSDFPEQPYVTSQRVNRNTSTPKRQESFHHWHERKGRSLPSHGSFTHELRVEEEERGELDGDDYENHHRERRRPWCWDEERNRTEYSDRDLRLGEVRERRFSRSESVRFHDRSSQGNRDLARTWSCKDYSDKHVRFRDDGKRFDRQQGENSGVWEMLGQVLRERGVPVRIGSNGVPLQIWPQSRESQVLHESEVSCSDSQPHHRAFQRASTTRHSFHGDIREKRRSSYRESSGRDHREDRDWHRNVAEHEEEVHEISRRNWCLDNREGRGSRKWRDRGRSDVYVKERNVDDYRVKRTTSEHRHWPKTIEERLSSEEEPEVERRRDQHCRRAPQRSQSLSSSSSSSRALSRHSSRCMAAGNI